MRLPVVLFLITLFACRPEKPNIPAQVLQPPQMAAILADIHVADALAETKAQHGASEEMVTKTMYQSVYALHNTTHEQFVNSYRFYESNPAWLDQIYDDVLIRISKLQVNSDKDSTIQ